MIGAFFGACTIVLGFKAMTNERAAIIEGLVSLNRENATLFYWIFTALSGVFVAIAGFFAIERCISRGRLIFGPTSMFVPMWAWFAGEKEIPYASIVSLTKTTVLSHTFLEVKYNSSRFMMDFSMMGDFEKFEEACKFLEFTLANSA